MTKLTEGRWADIQFINWIERLEAPMQALPCHPRGNTTLRAARMALDVLRISRDAELLRVHERVALNVGLRMPRGFTPSLGPMYQHRAPTIDRAAVNEHSKIDPDNATLIGSIAAAYALNHGKRRNFATDIAFFSSVGAAAQSEKIAEYGRSRVKHLKGKQNVGLHVGMWGQAIRMGERVGQEEQLIMPHTAVGLIGGLRSAWEGSQVSGYAGSIQIIKGMEDVAVKTVTEDILELGGVEGFDNAPQLHRYISRLSMEAMAVSAQAQLPNLGFNRS